MQRLLERIGLDAMPPPDVEGLRALHRAYVASVPYEDLAVQLGESARLDEAALTRRVLSGGRGGYCFEVNTVLCALLRAAGFTVERREARVNDAELCNHMALVVRVDGREFLADAGLGEGPLDPVELGDGVRTRGPLSWSVARTADGWRLDQHPWGSIDAGVTFGDAPAGLADFDAHHLRLATDPSSSFVRTLVLQRPFDDRIVTLRSRTLSVDGPGRRDRVVLADAREFAEALREEFGVDPGALGPERLRRLWAQACEQHEAFVAR